MWFKFPQGQNRISLQQMNFKSEASDESGNQFFRAPDHFAGIILDQPGYTVAEPPKGAPADLPKPDSAEANVIPLLTGQIKDLQVKLEAAEAAFETVKARLASVAMERDELKLALHESTMKIQELEDSVKSPPAPEEKKRYVSSRG